MKMSTLQFRFRGGRDALVPQDGCVVHESKSQLRLLIEVLPALSNWRVEHVRHVKRNSERHVRLYQVSNLSSVNCELDDVYVQKSNSFLVFLLLLLYFFYVLFYFDLTLLSVAYCGSECLNLF